jgi:hypothetical protein
MLWPPDTVPMKRLPERMRAATMTLFSSKSWTWLPASCQDETAESAGSAQPGVEAR